MPKLEMNLIDYLRVIRKRMRIIILCFVFVLASTIYYSSKQTPIYSTSCKIKIEQRKSVAEILTELVTWSPGDEMISQANIIGSFEVMEKVAERLNLLNPSMNEAERMIIFKKLQSQISTAQVEYTNIIGITSVSSNPEYAANLVNTVAEEYVNYHFENKKREASQVKDFVKEQLDNYYDELQNAEETLRKFRGENPLVIERNMNSLPIVQTDPRVTSLKQEIVKFELELISLKSKYTDEHPQVKSLKQKLDRAKSDLSAASSQLEAQQRELSTKESTLVQLKRNVSIAQDIYLMFKTKHEEARILEAEKAHDVTIIERALVPRSPIRPDVNFNIMVGIFSGILLGLIMAFVTESFDTSIGRIDDIEEILKVPVLGIIPNTSLEKGRGRFFDKFKFRKAEEPSEVGISEERLVTLFNPSSVAAEAYKSLRTNIDLTGLKKAGSTIVISSSAPQEGKTQTLCNLAIAFAQGGQKVLILGSDFRKPTIYRIFGLPRSPGLTEVLIGNISWKEATNTATDMLLGGLGYERILQTQGIENLNIITCGARSPNPAELLSFSEMDELIKEFKQNFDLILFDSAPTLPVTDSAILGAKADGVILVYQAGKTSRNALFRSKAQLENVNVKILGIVINNLKAQFIEDVTPAQRYRYYGYYGEKKKKTQ